MINYLCHFPIVLSTIIESHSSYRIDLQTQSIVILIDYYPLPQSGYRTVLYPQASSLHWNERFEKRNISLVGIAMDSYADRVSNYKEEASLE